MTGGKTLVTKMTEFMNSFVLSSNKTLKQWN